MQHNSWYLLWLSDIPLLPSAGAEFVPTKALPESHEPMTDAQSLHCASAKDVQQADFTSASPSGAATSTSVFFRSKNLVSPAQPPPTACERTHAVANDAQVGTESQHVAVEHVEDIAPAQAGSPDLSFHPLGQVYAPLTICNMAGAATMRRRRVIPMLET